jgi:hypothetical protein
MSERAQRLLLLFFALLLTVGTSIALRRARQRGALSLATALAPPPIPNVSVRFRDVKVTGYEKSQRAWVLTTPIIDTEHDRRTMRFPEGLSVTLLDKNKPAATLRARNALFTDQTKLDFPQGLEATLLQNEKTRATLSAPTASFDTASRRFLAAGTIQVIVLPPAKPAQGELPTSLGKLTLTCTQLQYDVGSRLVTCQGDIKILTESGHEVRGRDLTLNIETHDFSLTEFRGRIRAKKDEIDIL